MWYKFVFASVHSVFFSITIGLSQAPVTQYNINVYHINVADATKNIIIRSALNNTFSSWKFADNLPGILCL